MKKHPADKKNRQAVIDATHPLSWENAGGIPVVARILYFLSKKGNRQVFLLVQKGAPVDRIRKRWRQGLEITRLTVQDRCAAPVTALIQTPQLENAFLFFDGTHIFDPRLIDALDASEAPCLLFAGKNDLNSGMVRGGYLNRPLLTVWNERGAQGVAHRCRAIFPEDIDPFVAEIRGPLTPYCFHINTREDCDRATELLIRSQQKHVMDFPAEFIDPFFENNLTRFLCNTPVTPNVITLLGVITAAVVFYLFWNGFFVAGAVLMFAVEILDGVDGKLARTKLHYTMIGYYEDVIDYFCENSWYVALGVGLSGTGPEGLSYLLAVILILSDTFDNIFYTLAGKWHGKSIDLFSPWDGAFRRIAGRRNIYGFMFIAGFVLGFPLQTFALASVWAAVTAAVHGIRLFQHGRLEKKLCREQTDIYSL